MALTETFEYDCEVRGPFKAVQVRRTRIIMDGDEEVSRTYHRHTLQCRTKTGVLANDPSSGTWGDTDISGEDASIQAICNALWTAPIKTAYETHMDSQSI